MQSVRMLGYLSALGALSHCPNIFAGGIPGKVLEEVVVSAQRRELMGEISSASQGTVLDEQFENRPAMRTAEILEVVPGLIVTQHSGDGKANQYFLRGFNLDHGTDFATRVDGLPVNMSTHAHGQGYSDLNFLIPELVERVEYKKGTYYAEEGDFSAAGAADIRYQRRLDKSFVLASIGAEGHRRTVLATSPKVAGHDLMVALQYAQSDGPWIMPDEFEKKGGLIKLTHGDSKDGYSVEAMGYSGEWRATDQIPERALQLGALDRYGNIDPTDGGNTHRYSVSAERWTELGPGDLRANVYALDYGVELNSNFTYFTDPEHGDQFQQSEDRRTYGSTIAYTQPLSLFGRASTLKTGAQIRYDDIGPIGLYGTTGRVRWKTVREDEITQTLYGGYIADNMRLASWLQAELGMRVDAVRFDVQSNLAANSGGANDSIASPKLALVFGPWNRTEYFLNAGRGFHSNDARGATMKIDPADGVTPTESVRPLVRATGAEIGLRTAAIPNLQLAASLWMLKLDSELTLAADASEIVPSGGTRRSGLELGAYYRPTAWLLVDADVAWTRARYIDDPEGRFIPNALERVASIGLTANRKLGWYGGARLRYFGAAPISQDNFVRSRASLQVHAEGGYHFNSTFSVDVGVFNLLNRRDADVSYFYPSQLANESEPVDDVHLHPSGPRTVRFTATARF